jgi:hypothetical protein
MQILAQLAEALDDLHDGAVIVLRVLVPSLIMLGAKQDQGHGRAGQASKQANGKDLRDSFFFWKDSIPILVLQPQQVDHRRLQRH